MSLTRSLSDLKAGTSGLSTDRTADLRDVEAEVASFRDPEARPVGLLPGAVPSNGAHRVQSLHIPCAAGQEIFATGFAEATKQELPETHSALEDAENRFNGTL